MNYFERAKQYRAKKRLGQNFLIDGEVIDDIIEAADIQEDDTVVEIGAGLGFVTEHLVDYAKNVIAIELDEDMVRELSKIKADNLEIVHADILKTDLSQFGEKIKIVANIPYYITSPIIAHLLGEVDDTDNRNRNSISEIVMMTQYEAAQRITANEKSEQKAYGLLSILAQFYADVEMVRFVKAKSFFPAPKVNSAVIKFRVRKTPLLELSDYSFFKKTAKACFGTRRKNLKNSLSIGGFSKETIQKALEALNIPETVRGETLSIEEIGNLSEKLKENL
ncbi:MAG: 16S rRNA (adenine(1518)-N(6)/adenine(1519)-N(6))-dimethyltransferase RsmA [Candidatus Gastranaerophilales bacterium]|nr:16S rRNA (adenine(1518)-N(6)/adenine(1519)-N(6))-dimethyltransferase RsmA [Candidatus Gastranaerophilales bacterium]